MRLLFKLLLSTICGAALSAIVSFASTNPYWPAEIGFGKQHGNYLPFLLFTAITGGILGMLSSLLIPAAAPQRNVLAYFSIVVSVIMVFSLFPAAWILEDRGAWPLMRDSGGTSSILADLDPLTVCWFPLMWSIGLVTWSFQQTYKRERFI